MPDPIWNVHAAALKLVDVAADALDQPFTSGLDDEPCPEARDQMLRAIESAVTLLAHFDNYEFCNGQSDPKEGACLT
jgi:hypothetical protein